MSIKLMGFFKFLYALILPDGKHNSSNTPPKQQVVSQIMTVTPEQQEAQVSNKIHNLDMRKVRWGNQIGRGGQCHVYKVVYEGKDLVVKKPFAKTSSSTLADMLNAAKIQMQVSTVPQATSAPRIPPFLCYIVVLPAV